MEVRLAKDGDAPVIAEVHVASWQGAYRGLLPDEFLDGLNVERRAQWWTQAINDPEIDVFVSLDDAGRIVGFASVQKSRDPDAPEGTGELTTIYVLPEWWGRGHGRALMEASLGRARERGFGRVTLWVLNTNQRARRFYEKAGFTTDGAQKSEAVAPHVVLEVVRYCRDL